MTLFKVVAAVFCESARQEINGKYGLGGVFGSNINLGTVPGIIPLAVFAELEPTTTGTFHSEFRFVGPDGLVVYQGVVDFFVQTIEPFTLALGPIMTPIQATGVARFELKPPGEDWQLIKSLHVGLDPRLLETAQPQMIGLAVAAHPST